MDSGFSFDANLKVFGRSRRSIDTMRGGHYRNVGVTGGMLFVHQLFWWPCIKLSRFFLIVGVLMFLFAPRRLVFLVDGHAAHSRMTTFK